MPSPALDMKHLDLVGIEMWIQNDCGLRLRYKVAVEAGVPEHRYLTAFELER
jgi:hypothetical protein